MQLTITSTEQITEINGRRCRVWDGRTPSGVRCLVFVPAIAVHPDEDASLFDRELAELAAPAEAAELRVIPLRNIL